MKNSPALFNHTYYYLNDDHTFQKCNMTEWGIRQEILSRENKIHIGKDLVNNKYIYTIWHGFDRDERNKPPLLFETCIVDSLKNGLKVKLKSYSTWDEAAKGHFEAVKEVEKENEEDNYCCPCSII